MGRIEYHTYDPKVAADRALLKQTWDILAGYVDMNSGYYEDLVTVASKLAARSMTQRMILVLVDGVPAGYAGVSFWPKSTSACIEYMGVFSPYRNQGIGHELLNRALDLFPYADFIFSELVPNSRSTEFYLQNGFCRMPFEYMNASIRDGTNLSDDLILAAYPREPVLSKDKLCAFILEYFEKGYDVESPEESTAYKLMYDTIPDQISFS